MGGAEASSHETNDKIQSDVNDHEALQDDEDIHSPEQEPDDSLIDESPLPMSILKKASKFRNKKLDASIANYSKVEISPGLFVKRPSSKTKMPPPAPLQEPNTHQKSQAQQNILPVVKVEQVHEKNSRNDMSVDIGLESPQMPKLTKMRILLRKCPISKVTREDGCLQRK